MLARRYGALFILSVVLYWQWSRTPTEVVNALAPGNMLSVRSNRRGAPRLWSAGDCTRQSLKQSRESVDVSQFNQSDVSVTIHATLYSQEAHLLKAALSKYDVLTTYSQRPWHALKHPISSKLPTAQKKPWCSAISNTSKYTNAALSELL